MIPISQDLFYDKMRYFVVQKNSRQTFDYKKYYQIKQFIILLMENSIEPISNVIVIDYQKLTGSSNLEDEIQKSYGKKGLGILYVRGIPNYKELRKQLLKCVNKLGHLPPHILSKCQREKIYYTRGWSCGRQKFKGKPDTSKGSYYFKGVTNQDYVIPQGQEDKFNDNDKLLFSGNVWLPQDLPQLQTLAMKFSQTIINVGKLLGAKIDQYLASKVNNYDSKTLEKMIEKGQFHVGRLLHYKKFQNVQENIDVENFGDWCGWHNDHGALTALTSAFYTDEEGFKNEQVATGGLYAKNRDGQPVRVAIPEEYIAFQIGQSMQILSGGHLMATPHCVRKSNELSGKGITRNTFALFMQPDPLTRMSVPEGQNPQNVAIHDKKLNVPPIMERWENGQYFKDFHHDTIQKYINQSTDVM